MSNVTRPKFDQVSGARIKYADSVPFDGITGRAIIYGLDHSNPAEFDQVTGLPTGVTATIQVQNAPQMAAPAAAPAIDYGVVSVTRIADQAYTEYPLLQVRGGQTVAQIRAEVRDRLGLGTGMVAVVNGQIVSDTTVVNGGAGVIFKETAKQRG